MQYAIVACRQAVWLVLSGGPQRLRRAASSEEQQEQVLKQMPSTLMSNERDWAKRRSGACTRSSVLLQPPSSFRACTVRQLCSELPGSLCKDVGLCRRGFLRVGLLLCAPRSPFCSSRQLPMREQQGPDRAARARQQQAPARVHAPAACKLAHCRFPINCACYVNIVYM